MFKRTILTTLLLFAASQLVFAHDAWIENKDGELMVFYGHASRHDSYDPQKIKEPKGFDSKGTPVPMEIARHKENASLVAKGKPAIVTVFFDNGYWVQTTDTAQAWKNIPKREAQEKFTVLASSKVRKYAKAILTPCATFAKPVGLALEIVPEKSPFDLKPGDSLPIRVLLDGKPLEGAPVRIGTAAYSAEKLTNKTDKDGRASVVIAESGPQAINVFHKSPIKGDPDADNLGLSASLTFDLK
ncbi:MAG: DUF4198 domain-containing protein [Pseudomonadota bacterium]